MSGNACPPRPAYICSSLPCCTEPGKVLQLAGSCTADNPAVTLGYFVNGTASTTATCPPNGTRIAISVRPSIATAPNCSYNSTPGYYLTSERRGLR